MANKIFSISTENCCRTVIYFLGFKIRILKSEMKDFKKEYIKLNCPVSEIPAATGSLRKIQLANLKMLKLFDDICKKNNIEYWLDFGNLLGAVRHKGFIPWDDDIDLGMTRENYEKVFELFQNNIGENDLYLDFCNNGKNRCFLKLKHKSFPTLAIDLFPYDFYYKKLNNDEKYEVTKKIKKYSDNKFLKLLCPFFIKNPKAMRRRFEKQRKSILEGHVVDKTTEPPLYYGIDAPHPWYDNFFFDYKTIFPLKNLSFENLDFPCPNDTESILKQVYGDYMELPDDCYPRHSLVLSPQDEKLLDDFIADLK